MSSLAAEPTEQGPDEGIATPPWRARDIVLAFVVGVVGSMAVLIVLIVLVAALSPGFDMSTSAQLAVFGSTIYASLLISGWYFVLKRNGASWVDAGLRPAGAGPVMLMFLVVLPMMILSGIAVQVSRVLFGEVPSTQEQVLGGEASLTSSDYLLLLLVGVLVAPIVEEFIFRGLIYRYLRGKKSVTYAVLVSAAIFAVAHFIPTLIPALFVLGIALALVAQRYDSIYPAMMLHALNNAIGLTILYASLN
ncbi:MAG: lysostaphin resistance A-like protein [Actinomycetota bacterium]